MDDSKLAVESHSTDDESAYRAVRRLDVTASAGVPALFHVHPYVTPLRVYMEKRGVDFDQSDNPAMQRGRWLEPSVARAVCDQRPEWLVEPAGIYLRDAKRRLGTTPDFFIRGDTRGLGVLQVKSVAPSVFEDKWFGGDAVPRWIEIQNATEVMLAEAFFGLPCFGVIAALTVEPFNMRCAVFEQKRDYELEAEILKRVAAFWTDVGLGREPTPDFEKDREVIEALHPSEQPGKTRDFGHSNIVRELLDKRAGIKSRMALDKAECDVIETEIRYLLGDAEYASGLPGWRITYRVEQRKGYTVEPSSSRVLRINKRNEEGG